MLTLRTIAFGRPMIGEAEKAAVAEVLSGPILVHGPRSQQFENDFAAWTGAPYAVSVSNCTAGMHLVYFAMGYGPGDEIIVPAMTHTATAHAACLVGATPVFVDCERRTGNIDIDAIENKITPRTRAISIVHFLGMPVDMVRINAIARKHNLFVLEDAALAVGTKLDGVHAGLHGDVGVFSFYPVKHITTAEGGMVITRNEDLARRIRLARATIILPGDIGVLAIADVGRVFLDGQTSDKWHTAAGGGLWLSWLGGIGSFAISVVHSSERTTVYAGSGFSY